MSTTQTYTNVTLYAPTGVMSSNLVKFECRTLRVEVGPYAQYAAAVRLTYVPKGSRKEREHVETYRPCAVILAGHGHMCPDGLFDESTRKTEGDISTVRSRYLSCDPRWQGDFDAKLAAYVAEGKGRIVADFRGHDSKEERLVSHK
jgi:hypothetical protein